MESLREYHYNKLGEAGKRAYKKILEAIVNYEEVVSVELVKNIWNVTSAIKNDNPELYYVHWGELTAYTYGSENRYELHIPYIEDKAEVVRVISRVKAVARGLQGDSNMRTMRNVHDYIGHTVTYDPNVSADYTYYVREDHNIIGPLIHHMGVCEGIARLTQLFLKILHVDCTYESGYAYGRIDDKWCHAWNMVYKDGQLLKMDVTWDLTNKKDTYYKYFCVDKDFWGE